jgi:hypothetical protein
VPADRPAAEQHRAERAGRGDRLEEHPGPRHAGRLGHLVAERRHDGGQQDHVGTGPVHGGDDAFAQFGHERAGDAQKLGERPGTRTGGAAVLTAGLRQDPAQVAGDRQERQPDRGEGGANGACVATVTWWPASRRRTPSPVYGATSPIEPDVTISTRTSR